jgi:hypothetical protein
MVAALNGLPPRLKALILQDDLVVFRIRDQRQKAKFAAGVIHIPRQGRAADRDPSKHYN